MTGTHDERLRAIMKAIDDPCDEGGYDTFCRERHGELCPEKEHCVAPEYACIARLRERLAREVIRINDLRRSTL